MNSREGRSVDDLKNDPKLSANENYRPAYESSSKSGSSIVARWTFDQLSQGMNNSPAPDFGRGTALVVGTEDPDGNPIPADADILNSVRQVSDSSSPGNAWRIRSSGLCNGYSLRSLTTGVQFNVPTLGHCGIHVSFDWLATNYAPGHGQFQYTVDGVSYRNLGKAVAVSVGNVWQRLFFDLSEISEVDNNPFFGWRFVASFNPEPFTLIARNEQLIPLPVEYGRNEAFVNASEAGLAVVSEPWLPTRGNFRFDTVVIAAELV